MTYSIGFWWYWCKMPANQIFPEELYELYSDTAAKGSSATASLSDEEMQYNLFEEFEVGAISFFHDNSLQILSDAGLISPEAVRTSQSIRRHWNELQATYWTRTEIRTHPRWKQLFQMCDDLLAELDT